MFESQKIDEISRERMKFEKYVKKLKDKGVVTQWYYNGNYHIQFNIGIDCPPYGKCKIGCMYCGYYTTCERIDKEKE